MNDDGNLLVHLPLFLGLVAVGVLTFFAVQSWVRAKRKDRTEVHQFCIYCNVDVIAANPHDEDCPIKTGFYPILPRDVEQEISCAGCRHFFEVGEYFTYRDREGFHNPFGKDAAVAPTCVDCALIDLKEAA